MERLLRAWTTWSRTVWRRTPRSRARSRGQVRLPHGCNCSAPRRSTARSRPASRTASSLDGSQGGYTYGDFPTIGGTPEVHASGEVWAQTLWDLRERFGRSYATSIITRAMELSPADPTMLDMRNAIVQADLVACGGRTPTISGPSSPTAAWAGTPAHRRRRRVPGRGLPHPPTGATTTLSGTVKDKDTGAPVAGALVYIGGHSSGYAGDYAASTDANGNYAITGVAPGTYPKVVMSAPGYELLVQSATVKPGAKAGLHTASQLGGQLRRWLGGRTSTDRTSPRGAARRTRSTTPRAPAGAAPPVTTTARRPTR